LAVAGSLTNTPSGEVSSEQWLNLLYCISLTDQTIPQERRPGSLSWK